MGRHEYREDCPDCQPALVDPSTGEVMSKTSEEMVRIMKMWWKRPFEERRAYMNVTLHNSRLPADIILAEAIVRRIQAILDTSTH